MGKLREELWPWDSQPQEAVEFDWGNPLSRGLVSAFNAATFADIQGPVTGVGTVNRTPNGVSFGPSSSVVLADSPLGTFTLLAVAYATSAPSVLVSRTNGGPAYDQNFVLQLQSGTTPRFGFKQASGGSYPYISSGIATPAGTLVVAAATYDGTTQRVYSNGILGASQAATAPTTSVSGVVTQVGAVDGTDRAANYAGAGILLTAIWSRALSNSEVAEISANPWQLFAPRRIWVPGSTGTSGVTGTFAATTANDTLASAGSTTIVGTLSRVLASDSLASAGSTTILGSLSCTLADDGLSATGAPGTAIAGSLAATLQGATLAATGTITQVGTLAVTLADATLASVGTTTIVGSLSSTLADARLNSAGYPGLPPEGSFWRFLGVPLNRMGL